MCYNESQFISFLNVLCRKCYLFLKLRSFKIQLIITKVRITFYIKRYLKLGSYCRAVCSGAWEAALGGGGVQCWAVSAGGDGPLGCQCCRLELLRAVERQRASLLAHSNGSCCSTPFLPSHEVLEELLSPSSHSEFSLLAGSVPGSR